MKAKSGRLYARLLGSASAITLLSAGVAYAEPADFSIAPQPLAMALNVFSEQSGRAVLLKPELADALTSKGVDGSLEPEIALAEMLQGTGLTYRKTGDTFLIVEGGSADPQSGSAAGDGADGTVEALIVTAQKREEDIQDVPIAISAFTQEDLTRSQVAGGPDLITQVPNMTFTKTNFSSYSVQLRGIGTQAISATTDPAVAVAFNNTPFIRNRFFEQEFYDLQRVEVLRGPQGTLYGRNATAGVVNIISQKPKFGFEARASGDVSNFNSSRIEGMVNIPLVESIAALRIAGAWTKRDGYATNEITGNPIDGRDLWSTRVSLRVTPNDRLDVNLIWEHFEEDDDRLRSGKQLCKKDLITEVVGVPVGLDTWMPNFGQGGGMSTANANFSQGCKRNSLYAPDSFQTPSGLMLPYYVPLGAIGLPTALNDPYRSEVQSPDLRVIESTIDPTYRAKSDLGELQVTFDLTDTLTLTSETAYATDSVYSLQDFNRFNTAPGAWNQPRSFDRPGAPAAGPNGGVFCDPQLGCSDRLVAVDVSRAESSQFSQELRLASDYDGPFNFSLGANFLRADSLDRYYVFINSLSLIAASGFASGLDIPYVGGESDNRECLVNGFRPGDPNGVYPVSGCVYIDPNPIESVNDEGHNYFLSKNPYKLISYAVFGEAYYQVTDALKITAGLRWTVDKKEAPRIPSWILATQTVGYPVAEVIEQEWREPTGRLTVDWKPDLSFTDETLLYASYAHGYKAGGANPPGYVRVFYADAQTAQDNAAESATRPKTFAPEFVDAFEIGAKNTFADGLVTANLAAFYYDYKDYQISEIVDRSAFNRNFDAEVWGVELEADWRPFENLRLGLKGGYEMTRIADGEQAIDLMDRTAGDPRWTLFRPFPTFASSCILPTWLFLGNTSAPGNPEPVLLGGIPGGNPGGCEYAYTMGVDPATQELYVADPPASTVSYPHGGVINYTQWSTDPDDYAGLVWPGGVVTDRTYPGWNPATAPNNGEGIFKQLGGNELPNAPNWTWTLTGDYTIPLPSDWLVSLHTDLHWQAESWWRVFNDHEYDKLDEYFTMNLAAIFTNEERGWNVMAYIKNVTDETAITGAFLNSDDTGLTTNVFLTEPRLYGLRVTKVWNGSPWFDAFAAGKGPYPLTVELGGQIQRHDAPYDPVTPTFVSGFSDAIDPSAAQNHDLDWGDGREVKLTYTMPNSPWSVSAGLRVGKTNGADKFFAEEEGATSCIISAAACAYYDNPKYYFHGINSSKATVANREEHTIVDFEVGRDMGMGSALQSRLKGGLRYGHLESTTRLDLFGINNWYMPPEYAFVKYSSHYRYTADFLAEREFEGVGPTLSWEAARRLWGDDAGAQVDLDWSVTGGVLFGKQKTSVSGEETAAYYYGKYYQGLSQVGPTVITPGPEPRSQSATVPVLDLSLGLSYGIQRLKIGAGYRWERYFDALDAGFDETREEDRTIDGPYFKLSVGFGG
jgi:outer membrane receptor protein involved in Fe transport